MHRRRILSLPPGAPFLASFVQALLAGNVVEGFPGQDDPLALSKARIYVPTRRAARALAAELARQLDAPAVLLPEIVPLGAMDADEAALLDESPFDASAQEAVAETERRLVLAQLILEWGRTLRGAIHYVDGLRIATHPDESYLVTTSPAQAFRMAGDLGALIDEFVIEGIDSGKLKRLVPDEFDKYWAITLTFLQIAFEHWPQHLQQRGLADRAVRQAERVEAEIRLLRNAPARKAEIVLGSTGTNSATAKLIACIASLPQGAVVLPGLDKKLDESSWRMLAPVTKDEKRVQAAGHEQAALHRLLHIMEATREDVIELGEAPPDTAARIQLVRQALLPAEATDGWPRWRSEPQRDIAAALREVAYIDAPDERTEALAIAIALRSALETPGRTAALITPDRNLAHRVRGELMRWGIEVDDSGGEPLAETPAGALAQLVLACADQRAGSADIIALLNHTAVRLGMDEASFASLRTLCDIAVLRGCAWSIDDPAASLEAARQAANDVHAHKSKRNIGEDAWLSLDALFTRLRDALQPLRSLRGDQPVSVLMQAHRQALAALCTAADGTASALNGADARTLQELFDSFIAIPGQSLTLSLDAYTALFANLAHETIVRGPRRTHPRIKILGLLEARLMPADLAVLGGLDETVWPPAARTDEFLNRPMRTELGLTPPERRIGQTAHDFVMAMGAPQVILSRAAKRDGAPTVSSRFVQRMAALADVEQWKTCRARGDRWLRLAEAIDRPEKVEPVERPEPRPPLELRPVKLSVTQIETWRRDPYAIYARRILGLEPLEDPDPDDDYAQYGTRLHDTLSEFHKSCPLGPLPPDATATLTQIASEQFANTLQDPDFRAFKWPRLLGFFEAFVEWENGRRDGIARIEVERDGSLPLALNDGSTFTLSGRADRFEFDADGAVTIIDFKSGSKPPSQKDQVRIRPVAATHTGSGYDCAWRICWHSKRHNCA